MNILYCPICGKKTLQGTDESDYEAGELYACASCGAARWMTEAEPVEHTAKPEIVYDFNMVKSMTELMIEKYNDNMSRYFLASAKLEFPAKGQSETIKFRRYAIIEEGQ